MYRYLYCLSVSICLIQITSGQANCDKIKLTGNVNLNWNDYKSKSDSSSTFDAVSSIVMDYDFVYSNDSLHVYTWCSFSPCKSWTKDTTDANLLSHERIHFEILEYFRRAFVKRIIEFKFSKQSFATDLESIYSDINNQEKFFQSTYDNETNFSMNKNEQIRWKKKIENLLLSMKHFDKAVTDLAFR
jgi:hypothetical protein